MTKKPVNPNPSRSKTCLLLEYILLLLCLAVVALRATFTEGPTAQSTTLTTNVGDSLYSLSVSAVLITAFVLWFAWNLLSKKFIYRLTGMEIGLCIFCVGALVAGLAAGDKRLAITDITVFLAPLLTAVLLVQILDTQSKIKIVLAVIAALGVVSAYQCAEQFFVSNQVTIEQYQQDPKSLLEPLGIELGSFQQFLFEHRLYSRGVRGFFTTRNSAGSFALIALFAALALFIDKFKNRRSDVSGRKYLLGCGIGAAVIIISLGLTRSKGAIIGLFFAAAVFILLMFFGDWLKAHRRSIFVVCLLLVIAGFFVISSYGLSHGRLPGGGSMLVRWQYWHASAKMYADHPLTGVGPGNFGDFYTYYKPAEALESVADPHNFPLSILTQYGPLGLVGFLAVLFMPLWRMVASAPAITSKGADHNRPTFRTMAVIILIVISATLLIFRPMLMPSMFAETLDVIIYVIVTMHVAPVAVFIVAFVLFAGPLRKKRDMEYEIRSADTAAALFCAVLGVLLHNMIDFAIFEPGVLTVFWAVVACIIAIGLYGNSRPPLVLETKPFVKILIVTGILAASWACINYALIPVSKSTSNILKANRAISAGQFDYAHAFLEKAAKDDVLSSSAMSLDGRLYLHRFERALGKNKDLLLRAEMSLTDAIRRNDTPFKNFERLTDVYNLLAEISLGQEKADWLNKAFDASSSAVVRYPGCGRLHFKQAQIAEQMGKIDITVEQYKKAIEIEDEYRSQFRQMYPERDGIVSRLGNENYLLAIKRVEELSRKSDL